MKVTSVSLVRHQSDEFKPAVQVLLKLSLEDMDSLKEMSGRDWDGMLACNALILARNLYSQLQGQLPNDMDSFLAQAR